MASIINDRESAMAALRARLDDVGAELAGVREAVLRAEARVRHAEDARRAAESVAAEAEARLEEMVAWRSDIAVEDSECVTLPPPITDNEPLVDMDTEWLAERDVDTAPALRRTA
jgi:chromosome segregation ATPase